MKKVFLSLVLISGSVFGFDNALARELTNQYIRSDLPNPATFHSNDLTDFNTEVDKYTDLYDKKGSLKDTPKSTIAKKVRAEYARKMDRSISLTPSEEQFESIVASSPEIKNLKKEFKKSIEKKASAISEENIRAGDEVREQLKNELPNAKSDSAKERLRSEANARITSVKEELEAAVRGYNETLSAREELNIGEAPPVTSEDLKKFVEGKGSGFDRFIDWLKNLFGIGDKSGDTHSRDPHETHIHNNGSGGNGIGWVDPNKRDPDHDGEDDD